MKETLLMEDSIAVWEGEGGGPRPSGLYSTGQVPLHTHSRPEHTVGQEQMSGTVNQIEWAVEIKERVNAEFHRVARALQSAAGKQTDRDRVDTQAVLAILEDKRAEVIARTQAG